MCTGCGRCRSCGTPSPRRLVDLEVDAVQVEELAVDPRHAVEAEGPGARRGPERRDRGQRARRERARHDTASHPELEQGPAAVAVEQATVCLAAPRRSTSTSTLSPGLRSISCTVAALAGSPPSLPISVNGAPFDIARRNTREFEPPRIRRRWIAGVRIEVRIADAVDQQRLAGEARGGPVVGEVARPVEVRVAQDQRHLESARGKAKGILFVVADDEAAGQPEGHLRRGRHVRMWVIPAHPCPLHGEVVVERATRGDWILRLAVDRRRHDESVPVDGRGLVEPIGERNRHRVAAADLEDRPAGCCCTTSRRHSCHRWARSPVPP